MSLVIFIDEVLHYAARINVNVMSFNNSLTENNVDILQWIVKLQLNTIKFIIEFFYKFLMENINSNLSYKDLNEIIIMVFFSNILKPINKLELKTALSDLFNGLHSMVI